MTRFISTLVLVAAMGTSSAMADPGGNGFGSFGLTDGKPSFMGCLNGAKCADNFFKFMNQASLEQGFAMQGGAVTGSSVVNHRTGWSVGGMLHTFPFAGPRKNLAGKTENTQFSPVLPKLTAARMWDSGERRMGVGFTMLPPVPVQGAAALILGAQASMAKDSGSGRLGLEVDLSFVRAKAPIAASDAQLEDSDSYADGHLDEEVSAENCDPDLGCIDTFTLANLEILGRKSWVLGGSWVPYVGAGVTLVNEFLHIQYDDTHWSVLGVQPAVHAGTGWTPTERLLLSAGASSALRQGNQSPDGLGVFYRLEGAAAYRF